MRKLIGTIVLFFAANIWVNGQTVYAQENLETLQDKIVQRNNYIYTSPLAIGFFEEKYLGLGYERFFQNKFSLSVEALRMTRYEMNATTIMKSFSALAQFYPIRSKHHEIGLGVGYSYIDDYYHYKGGVSGGSKPTQTFDHYFVVPVNYKFIMWDRVFAKLSLNANLFDFNNQPLILNMFFSVGVKF